MVQRRITNLLNIFHKQTNGIVYQYEMWDLVNAAGERVVRRNVAREVLQLRLVGNIAAESGHFHGLQIAGIAFTSAAPITLGPLGLAGHPKGRSLVNPSIQSTAGYRKKVKHTPNGSGKRATLVSHLGFWFSKGKI